MLIGFKVQNFRSFLHEQTFSFLTSSDRMHESTHLMRTGMRAVPRVSKAAIVFGPNAGGKTNLILAIAMLRDLVLQSADLSATQFRDRYTPFRFGTQAMAPTEFEIDLLLTRIRYRYAIAYDGERILRERLLVYRTGKSQRWFDRQFDPAAQRDVWAPFSPNFHGPRERWRKSTRGSALFVTTAARLGSTQLGPFMRWMEHCVETVLPTDIHDLERPASRLGDPVFKARMVQLLQAAGLGIADIRVTHGDEAPEAAHGTAARTGIQFLYDRGSDSIWSDAAFESSGTLRLLGLLTPLIDAIDHGKLLLVDEFDTSLHPLVARLLVRRINDPAESSHGAQLLLTSHNTTLMDLNFLRRDEIWLAQLNEDRATSLLPLQRTGPRKREAIAKNYLRGRYGAVPRI